MKIWVSFFFLENHCLNSGKNLSQGNLSPKYISTYVNAGNTEVRNLQKELELLDSNAMLYGLMNLLIAIRTFRKRSFTLKFFLHIKFASVLTSFIPHIL